MTRSIALIAAILVVCLSISVSAAGTTSSFSTSSRKLLQGNPAGNCSDVRPVCKGNAKFKEFLPFRTKGYNASPMYRACKPGSTCLTFVTFFNYKAVGVDRASGTQLKGLKTIKGLKNWQACALACANNAAEEPASPFPCAAYSFSKTKVCRLMSTSYIAEGPQGLLMCGTKDWVSGYSGTMEQVRAECKAN